MKATELVGRVATRTGRTKIYRDGSYMNDALLITYADDSHIHVEFMNGILKGNKHLLDKDFCDEQWREWGELQDQINEEVLKIQKQLEIGRIFVK